jgi:hypothetical protein
MVQVSKKLAPFTPKHNGVSIRYGGEPKEPLPIHLTHEGLCTNMTPADSCVMSYKMNCPSSGIMHFIRVPLVAH